MQSVVNYHYHFFNCYFSVIVSTLFVRVAPRGLYSKPKYHTFCNVLFLYVSFISEETSLVFCFVMSGIYTDPGAGFTSPHKYCFRTIGFQYLKTKCYCWGSLRVGTLAAPGH